MSTLIAEPRIESMLRAKEVAEYLGVSICSLRRWDRQGVLKGYRVGNRGDLRYRLDEVNQFLERSRDNQWSRGKRPV